MADGARTGSGIQSTEATGDLKADFAQLREDFAALKKDLASLTTERASDAKASLQEGLAWAEEHAKATAESASTELHEIQRQTERAIRKKPLTALAGALAIGYFIATIRK